MRARVSVESKLERARSLESSPRTPTKRERERELYVLGGDVLKRYEKDFFSSRDILMRKTARGKRERIDSAKKQTTNAFECFAR